MQKIPAMVDMRRTPAELAEDACPTPISSMNAYPYGLCISLTEVELEKLGLDDSDVEVGDMLHIHAMARVTSVSKTQTESDGQKCRVELQIEGMVGEDEDEENTEADRAEATPAAQRRSRLYAG